jgi:hypothetical protein
LPETPALPPVAAAPDIQVVPAKPAGVEGLKAYFVSQDSNLAEVARLLGITDVNDRAAWLAHGNTPRAIFEKAMKTPKKNPFSDSPAAAPFEWTPEALAAIKAEVERHYWTDEAGALKLVGKTSWNEFPTRETLSAAVRTAAYEKGIAFLAHSATYGKDGKGKPVIEFDTPVKTRLYSREQLRQLGGGWAAYVDAWVEGQTYGFDRANLNPLIITYERKNGYALVTKVDEFVGNIPF